MISVSLSWATLCNMMGILQLHLCYKGAKLMSEKTNMLGKMWSPVSEVQELEQPSPHEDHHQPLPARVMKHSWQGQRP